MGSVDLRTHYDVWDRPHYAYGVFQAAHLAKELGIPAISAIEFGVAGGNGLVSLERIAAEVGQRFGVQVNVYGFDSGTGMPAAVDYRDLPYVWAQGFYAMDVDALKKRLVSAELLLGPVGESVKRFTSTHATAPIGFVAFDLDYYSSTVDALRVFDTAPALRLPRIYCYFDDIIWPEHACHNEFTGELLAIKEFNVAHGSRKIAPLSNLRWMRARARRWNEQIYVMHDFEHPEYARLVTPAGDRYRQLPLR